MRRLLRWVFNGAAAVSALLFLAVCVLWVRSYCATDGLQLPMLAPTVTFWSQRGRGLVFIDPDPNLAAGRWIHDKRPIGTPVGFDDHQPQDDQGPTKDLVWEHFAGFAVEETFWHGRQFIFPYWAVTLINVVLFAVSLAFRRRFRRRRAGSCARCGYDMRATPSRCPECGTEVVAAPK